MSGHFISHPSSRHDGHPTCSRADDFWWRDHRWLFMELDKCAQDNPVDLSCHISLCDLSQLLQKWGLDDKIALFCEYAQHNHLGIIVTSDVIQQLLWKSDTPKEIGYWRDTIKHKGERPFWKETYRAEWNQAVSETRNILPKLPRRMPRRMLATCSTSGRKFTTLVCHQWARRHAE